MSHLTQPLLIGPVYECTLKLKNHMNKNFKIMGIENKLPVCRLLLSLGIVAICVVIILPIYVVCEFFAKKTNGTSMDKRR